MKIDLTELLKKVGNEAELEESEEISFPEDGLTLVQPIKISLHLVNTGPAVILTGKVKTELELECSRCLKTYKQPLDLEIEEEFSRQMVENKKNNEIELQENDFVYPIEKDNSINLTEIIRQDLLLEIPMKPLCGQSCSGLSSSEKGE